MPRVVANTTPLIAFAKVDRLDILRRLYGELLIPEAVL
jgi:predicted nucleic acid-binding protein